MRLMPKFRSLAYGGGAVLMAAGLIQIGGWSPAGVGPAQAQTGTCDPTRSGGICIYEKSPTAIGIRIVIKDPRVKCMDMRYTEPSSRVPVIKPLRPVYPITEITHTTREKGRYNFAINYQVFGRDGRSCPVPFNFGGAATSYIRK